nr:MAG TPA: hypothetical protein [Caudoviricetes sp.]
MYRLQNSPSVKCCVLLCSISCCYYLSYSFLFCFKCSQHLSLCISNLFYPVICCFALFFHILLFMQTDKCCGSLRS